MVIDSKKDSPLLLVSIAKRFQERDGAFRRFKMSERYMTSDFWLGGVLLSEADAKLVDVQINRNGRETVVFSFSGENLSRTARAYCNQQAVANVTQLREKINLLRDYIFQTRSQS